MAEQKTYSIKIDGIEQNIKNVESLGENVSKTGNAWKDTQKALKAVKSEMAGLDKSSDQWKQLAKVAGDYKDRLDDINQAARRFASDTKALDDAINIGQSLTSVYTLAEGAMSAFGFSTDGVVESIQKLQGAMAIIQSLQSLQNTLRGSTATTDLLTKSIGLMTKGMQGASLGAKALRIALASIGIGIIIGLVSELVMHWEDLVEWFDKTFPAVKKVGGVMNGLKATIMGLGKAIINWCVNPLKTMADVIKKLFSGDFEGAVKAATDGIKNQFSGTAKAFKDGFQSQVEKGLEEISLKTLQETNKQTKYHLDMLKAQKGNQARFSKEGIALQKKDFEERKRLAKGNKEELNKIALEEATFYREMQENKTAAAKKANAERTKLAKQAADEQKKADEAAKKAAEYKAKADEALYRSTAEYLIKQQEQLVDYYNAEVKLYSAGPVEKYQEAVAKVNEETKKLVTLQRQLHLYDFFNDYRQNIDASTTSLNDFMANMNVLVEQFKLFGDKVSVEEFGVIAKQLSMFSNLTEDQLKYLYHIYIDYLKDGFTKTKETTADIKKVQEEQLKKEMEGIEKTTLQFELESDKKSDKAVSLVKILNKQWDNYLEHVKQVYGEDSKEYLEAQKKKQQAVGKNSFDNQSPINQGESKTKGDKLNGGFGFDDTNWKALWDTDSPAWQNIMKLNDLLFENVFDPINDAFQTMLEFQIEEAQEALDEATEMHDKSVEKVQASQDKINELNEKMKNSSGAQLEAYKQQQADEMLLMAQREAEEKRLAREKEKKEKELERKQKQQRKLDLQMSLITGIANTAESVTKALTWGFPLGVIFAAIVGAMGAIQTAIIAKQMSKLADGGLLQGKSHSQGGIPVGNTGIEVEGGEYVINKRSTAKYLPLLQALNEEGARKKTVANQLGKMANGGQLNYERIDSNMNSVDTNKVIERTISSIDMHPQVSVVDINRGQKNLTQVRQMAGGRA